MMADSFRKRGERVEHLSQTCVGPFMEFANAVKGENSASVLLDGFRVGEGLPALRHG